MYIDSLTTKPRVRHIVREELDNGSVVTACGRTIKYWFNADNTSWHYHDSDELYARRCKLCFLQAD